MQALPLLQQTQPACCVTGSQDAGVAYGTLAAVLALGAVSTLGSDSGPPGSSQLDLFYFVSLAVCTHYIGAHRSLSAPNRAQVCTV